MENLFLVISILSALIWLGLLLFRGEFWLCTQSLNHKKKNNLSKSLKSYPSICAIIPARNEEDVISTSLNSLLAQEYLGKFSLILVNDQSTDNTQKIAQEILEKNGSSHSLNIISGIPLEKGWSGKLWAVNQGINYAEKMNINPDYFLLTDADIEHDHHNLYQLIYKAETENLALVSLMVKLRCKSFWEKLLIPAFIYFFQKLYPFKWVNNYYKKMAAAAGGCILIRREILQAIGGISCVKDALIDDCSLAQAVKEYTQNNKKNKYQGIWLGLDEKTISLRSYNSLKTIWDMVARTAYTQLNYSFILLIGTIVAMILVYLISLLGIIIGIILRNNNIIIINLVTYLLITISYFPIIKIYKCSYIYIFTLPFIAFLYTLMTIDSAVKYLQGKYGSWKGRVYG